MAFVYKLLQKVPKSSSDQPAFEKELTDTFKKCALQYPK